MRAQIFVLLFDNENALPIDPDIYASYANALWNEANWARAPPPQSRRSTHSVLCCLLPLLDPSAVSSDWHR